MRPPRLYTAPDAGQLVAMDSRRRVFPRPLRQMVVLRDPVCRTPYCNAQVTHLDHATPCAARALDGVFRARW